MMITRLGVFLAISLCMCARVDAVAVALQDCADRYAGRICRGEVIDIETLNDAIESVQRVLQLREEPSERLGDQDFKKMDTYFYDEQGFFQSLTVETFKRFGFEEGTPRQKFITKVLVDMVCSRLH